MARILIVFLASMLAHAAQVVEGRVVNAVTGAGIPQAKVGLIPTGDTPDENTYRAVTDAEGRFHIEGVKDGTYRARYNAPGFSPILDPASPPPSFAVAAAGDPVRLEVRMRPLGKLSGRVKDAGGQVVPNASIWLVRGSRYCRPPFCSPARRQTNTNEKGEYTFDDLAPGPWMISAIAPAKWTPPEPSGAETFGWVETFFPGVTDAQLAQPVTVGFGDAWAPDIKLAAAPVHRVRGRVLDARGQPAGKASVSLARDFGSTLTMGTREDGAFEFAAQSGEWRLSAGLDRGGVTLKSIQSIEVKREDLEDIELHLAEPFVLTGKLVLEVPAGTTAPPRPPIDLLLNLKDALLNDGPAASLPVRQRGSELTVPDVYPGDYDLQQISEPPVPYYLDSIRLGDRDVSGPVSIQSAAQPLTVTYKLGGGTVRGAIEGCAGQPVILIPQEPALRRGGLLRVTTCDGKGQFEFPSVRPGDYLGFALPGETMSFADILQDADLLRQAAGVKVHAGEAASPELRMITR